MADLTPQAAPAKHFAFMKDPETGKVEFIEAPAAEISSKLVPLMAKGWVQVPEPDELKTEKES